MTKLAPLMLASVLAAAVVPAANAAIFVAAQEATGVVTAVDRENGTIRIGHQTFTATPARLRGLYRGYEIRIQYVNEAGELRALVVTRPSLQRHEDE